MDRSAIQKYGKADVMTKIGGSALSSQPPRLQALIRPMNVPRMKASTVVTPTSPSVHGSAWNTIVSTESPKLVVIEMPKLNVTTCFQYSTYWLRKPLVGLPPSSASQRVEGLRVEVRVLGHQDLYRVAGHEARDQEVEADRRPQRDDEEPEPP